MKTYTKAQYEKAAILQAEYIEQLEAEEPDVNSLEYIYWQPRLCCAKAVLRGMISPFRGPESLDRFAMHGGVNVQYRMLELERENKL